MTASAASVLKRLYEQFGTHIAFLTVYVREAHPGERYPQPETFERKLEHARQYQRRDEIPWTVAVDDIEGTFHQAMDAKPNSAYLVDGAGIVIFRALWGNEERPLRRALEEVTMVPARRVGEDTSKVVPMLRGVGSMAEVLTQAGRTAVRDVRRQVPPLWFMARVASLFRPLPPLARGIAAAGVFLLGAVGITALVVTAVRRRG
ncbi:MAG: hypothetical protein HYY16_06070 [Planctomycetes bacterium]|nr:hypothetical protein [Planctomycetota bacterium]